MATFPNSANPTLCLLTTGDNGEAGMVNIVNNGGVPGVITWMDRTGTYVASQTTAAKQPTLGTMAAASTAQYTDVKFAGSQFLIMDALASNLVSENAALDFTVFVVASTSIPSSTNMDLFTLGKSGSDGYVRLSISGSAAKFSTKNDSGTVVSGTLGTVDTKPHIYALVKSASAGTVSLYFDSTSAPATASVSGNFTPNQCTIGALRDNGSTSNYLTGNIAEVCVVKGTADLTALFSYFNTKYTAKLD